ncbi:MAG: hypothetical protein M3083_13045 [Actinomycetota bacterium]|nr:hypothetical protein [Actinomycetota bacterium]
MNNRLTRRSFMIGAATALGAAACSKSRDVIRVGNNNGPQLNLSVSSGAGDGPNEQTVSVFVAGIDQRVAFVLAGKSGPLSPTPGSVSLQFGRDDKRWGPPVPVDVHADTGAPVAGTYLATSYQFPKPGTYWLHATFQGQTADAPVVVIDRSVAMVPWAGQKMISTPTPTDADHRGVNPICTRTPECPFHRTSLDQALTQHLPIALLFSTPALCETRTCGPVLDTVVAASSPYAGKINFVHSEIFTALSRSSANTPAVLAYHLQSEPIMFLADARGTIVERVDGLVGQAEVAAALVRLTRF